MRFSTWTTSLGLAGLLALIGANLWWWHNPVLGVMLGAIYLAYLIDGLGSLLTSQFPTDDRPSGALLIGSIFTIALLVVGGGSTLYAASLPAAVGFLILIILPVLTAGANRRLGIAPAAWHTCLRDGWAALRRRPWSLTPLVLPIAYVICRETIFKLLWLNQTTQSIQAPWQVVPGHIFFGLYVAASALLVWYVLTSKHRRWPLVMLALHGVLSLAVALVVYAIGYGFDPFIHQATERIIAVTGTITPKPPYYLGQYGLVLLLHWLTQLPLELIDRALVPTVAGLFIAPTAYLVLKKYLPHPSAGVAAILAFALPYSSFIMTTPQNLANVFFVVAACLLLLTWTREFPIRFCYALSIATILIHPLAGIPAFLLVSVSHLARRASLNNGSRAILVVAAASSSLVMPALFWVRGATFDLVRPPVRAWLTPLLHFDVALDLTYWYRQFGLIIFGVMVILGLAAWRKTATKPAWPLMIGPTVLGINFLLVRFGLRFGELQSNDQNEFTLRLGILTLYSFAPLMLLGVGQVIERLRTTGAFSRFVLSASVSLVLAMSLYLSYPRVDQYDPTPFFSLSHSDLAAVERIEQLTNEPHIVLANQMIGVAAITRFGFAHYYAGQFYYSMPSGDPHTLYDRYLDMIYQGAKRETMLAAMDEAGVDYGFFVLNRYWRNFEKIAAQAATGADSIMSVDNDAVMIFGYRRESITGAGSDQSNTHGLMENNAAAAAQTALDGQ